MRAPATEGDPVKPLDPLPRDTDARQQSGGSYELEASDQEREQTAGAAEKQPEAAGDVRQSSSSTGANPGKCPSCNSRLKAGAVICINCGYNLKTGRTLETHVDTSPQEEEDG